MVNRFSSLVNFFPGENERDIIKGVSVTKVHS